jgi:thiosulfate dehydrogenase [quinone] large subunit
MLGLLGVGLALILGIAMKLAAIADSIMMILIWLAVFPPQNNPLIDEHIIYSLILVGLAKSNAETYWNLNKWWLKTGILKKLPFLT